MKIGILGSGAWGTAMAVHLARGGHEVILMPKRKEAARRMAAERENTEYLPGIRLDESITIADTPSLYFPVIDFLILAAPSKGMRQSLLKVQPLLRMATNLRLMISLCKGMEQDSGKSATALAQEILGDVNWAVLSGPSYAKEVAEGKPTALSFASRAPSNIVEEAQSALSGPKFRLYRTLDVTGVELGGCLKNVYAIGAGICDGLKLGDNAKAAYLTRSLHEMTRLGIMLGGQGATFCGLSGLGDLVATSEGVWSRNRTLGQKIAEGNFPRATYDSSNHAIEGYWTCQCFYELAQQKDVACPILQELFNILFNGKDSAQAVNDLMNRDLKQEAV